MGRDDGPIQHLRVEVVKQGQPGRQTVNKLRPVADLIHSRGHPLMLKQRNVVLCFSTPGTASVLDNFHYAIGCASLEELAGAPPVFAKFVACNWLVAFTSSTKSAICFDCCCATWKATAGNLRWLWLRNWVPWTVSWHWRCRGSTGSLNGGTGVVAGCPCIPLGAAEEGLPRTGLTEALCWPVVPALLAARSALTGLCSLRPGLLPLPLKSAELMDQRTFFAG